MIGTRSRRVGGRAGTRTGPSGPAGPHARRKRSTAAALAVRELSVQTLVAEAYASIAAHAAELHAFDLARDRAELAVRIDLHFDPAARGLLDLLLVELEELMLPLVHRRCAEFHDEIGSRGRCARREAYECRGNRYC